MAEARRCTSQLYGPIRTRKQVKSPPAWAPDLRFCGVEALRHYSYRPDLLQQLRQVAMILSDDSPDDDAGMEVTPEDVVRSRRLRDRFSSDDLQVSPPRLDGLSLERP